MVLGYPRASKVVSRGPLLHFFLDFLFKEPYI